MVVEARSADRVMDALGHQTRRDILALLKVEPMPVGAIATQLPVSRPAVSKHLRKLERAGLVEYRPSGASNIFRLKAGGFDEASHYLEDFWDAALASFQNAVQEHVESE